MWMANAAGPASFSAPRHIHSMPAMPYGMPAWQHGWYMPQQHLGQLRPPVQQQQPVPPTPQQQQQQQQTALRRQ
jgi:hypothetical protein